MFVVVFLLASFAFADGSNSLKISAGTMSIGGRFTIPFKYDSVGFYEITFQEETEFSYFVADSVRLIGAIEVAGRLTRSFRSDGFVPPTVNWGAKIGADYIFDLKGSLYPYVGLKGGFRVLNGDFGGTLGLAEISAGILWALNDKVALSFGIPLEMTFGGETGFKSLQITPGFLGLTGFF